ncbi:hypothetical protein CONPUDRAFT_105451 [Coniophora puteana RWD-64-598 SS2]|uniref:BTB domain-containing protein n=1 Tax=Coniophora puteana (strain RWD-64-598) TaxID=741705 RepID=A0A5M3MMN1_CONPW|nr:uncharacterized protein CONPUDRAFT_105451 [Coniophora puteana RWD-64-598 SS2]EIW80439.1 hypothetical protein CONPUDRAFT_105451 [Coniophora puteana RWD-64-598 SS2]
MSNVEVRPVGGPTAFVRAFSPLRLGQCHFRCSYTRLHSYILRHFSLLLRLHHHRLIHLHMDTYAEPLAWSYASEAAPEPLSFIQIPGSNHVETDPSQLLTPPCSALSSNSSPLLTHDKHTFTPSVPDILSSATDEGVVVSVSTTFFPGSDILTIHPDVIILSSDSVFFYVHSSVLLRVSHNAFNGLIYVSSNQGCGAVEPVIPVTEHSSVLNIVLHGIYGISCSHYAPSFESLSSAIAAFPKYGLSAEKLVASSMPLYTLLMSHAPLHPLEVYALAAKYNAHDLAVSASSHLLSFPLASISDDVAAKIGPKYLKRLFFLHLGRLDALKRLLLSPPHPHPPTENCSFEDQKRVTRAWALASAHLVWDTRPDLSTSSIQSALGPLEEQLSCNMCRRTLRDRLNHIIVQWSIIKRTI